mmetsp:Transcript_21766/g.24294  ORF Transcript_21766/g.24294 Transcript_21766/m.24294 type:complete len:91 (+) Transcript_21766:178-450(+)
MSGTNNDFLLCHPAGLELLRSYASLKKKGSDNDLDSSLCTVLAKKLAPVVREQETCISSTIIEVINDEGTRLKKNILLYPGKQQKPSEAI